MQIIHSRPEAGTSSELSRHKIDESMRWLPYLSAEQLVSCCRPSNCGRSGTQIGRRGMKMMILLR